MRHGIYAGVFDPLTLGHLSVIQTGFALFDKLTIGIGKNPSKKTMFSAQERKNIILNSIEDVFGSDKNIEVEIFEDEFLIQFAKRKNASFILRGIRDSEDFRQEQAYKFFNKEFAPEIEPVFVMPDMKYNSVSSSAIKGMVGPPGWQDFVKPYLPKASFIKIVEKHTAPAFVME